MRLDLYLVEKGYVKSRSQASDLIKRSLIEVDGKIQTKAGLEVLEPSIKILEEQRFVSRAGEKLMTALLDFDITLHGKIMVDIGSSTGGFTDCAIQEGILKVYAYDVGSNQMDETLKKDPRIELHESTNILDVALPDCNIITIDVSFTSVLPILSHLKGFDGEMIVLIKPQFEAGPIHFKQGVLKDIKMHEKILTHVLEETRNLGFSIRGLKKSSLKGKMGNQEYVMYIHHQPNLEHIPSLVRGVLC
ncbi:MAG: hypothetical protein A2Y45_00175 [Tenericutes bacterium GWC2_34_14]|nr:MAG: hypothetical protein A2Z84_02295 [Tenericutes bacterium GWA2_35_7]OHE29321.1 MAG: hypothetical protein A2Y45_00175 [Tenericutes bacterium GWC2_34_14]OHE34418.1 MAG: hypothetical protein A2012_07795 [Tenericutes bacterium GWE2_34_108]OHE35774.1 MAG: hypothetical protein A2Y46_02500 [Tenericutes bacterium GWF1_35_14]OHE39139.1 MAG: hypothetical protein A2Y44_07430 [Tenericutes bacterium GWF2_35_184]OHE42376.1 MAG: hypothetical protein A3K26_04910 [Tenericutes bacterium RIFOXYA12_FULL_35_